MPGQHGSGAALLILSNKAAAPSNGALEPELVSAYLILAFFPAARKNPPILPKSAQCPDLAKSGSRIRTLSRKGANPAIDICIEQ
jgi:hypothetical protein